MKELLYYAPNTGAFIRRVSTGGASAGDIAGSVHPNGYVMVGVNGFAYGAHRLAWLYEHGRWPDGHIDHINGDKADNRLVNLREVTRAENLQNQRRPHKNNILGVLGVSPNGSGFKAVIWADGKNTYLGTYKTPDEAHQVYLDAKRELHPGATV